MDKDYYNSILAYFDDKNKPGSDKYIKSFISKLSNKEVINSENRKLSEPKETNLEKILKQRHRYRKIIFWGAIGSTALSWLLLVAIITTLFVCKILCLFGHKSCCNVGSLLNGYELEVFCIGVFVQVIGVIVVISKSLWDDTPYKDHLTE